MGKKVERTKLTPEQIELVEKNMSLSKAIPIKLNNEFHFDRNGFEMEDLIQIASMTITECALKYNPDDERNASFTTYTITAIRNNIIKHVSRTQKKHRKEEEHIKHIESGLEAEIKATETQVYPISLNALAEKLDRQIYKNCEPEISTLEVLKMLSEGDKPRDIAKRFNVDVQHVYGVIGKIRYTIRRNEAVYRELV